jgi:hypothetical protein
LPFFEQTDLWLVRVTEPYQEDFLDAVQNRTSAPCATLQKREKHCALFAQVVLGRCSGHFATRRLKLHGLSRRTDSPAAFAFLLSTFRRSEGEPVLMPKDDAGSKFVSSVQRRRAHSSSCCHLPKIAPTAPTVSPRTGPIQGWFKAPPSASR